MRNNITFFSQCGDVIKHILLHSSHYGFRKGDSTQHAILDIVNAIQSNMNQSLFSCGVFLDFKKAFDTVDHNILLDQLNHYGFRGTITVKTDSLSILIIV